MKASQLKPVHNVCKVFFYISSELNLKDNEQADLTQHMRLVDAAAFNLRATGSNASWEEGLLGHTCEVWAKLHLKDAKKKTLAKLGDRELEIIKDILLNSARGWRVSTR